MHAVYMKQKRFVHYEIICNHVILSYYYVMLCNIVYVVLCNIMQSHIINLMYYLSVVALKAVV